jgi:indolepyruvate ferredoxin oxidoreductase
MLGYAWQRGWVPLSRESIRRAMELNDVQIANNHAAFEWGRRAAHDLPAVQALTAARQVIHFAKQPSLDETLAHRSEFLTAYQNAAYAQAYRGFVERVRARESALADAAPASATVPAGPAAPATSRPARQALPLTEAVARYLFKLMAYKDEYEVARLHSDPAFHARLAEQFEGKVQIGYHLAPPLLARRNDRGELQKQPFGAWMGTAFRLLARLKGLRGTPLDPFGRSAERRTERALISEYRACIDELLAGLTASNQSQAAEIARLPEGIRGYGHVKERHLAETRAKWAERMAAWRAGRTPSAG